MARISRRTVLRAGALGVAVASAPAVAPAQQGATAVMMTVTGGCLYAFNKRRTALDLIFPTVGHQVVLKATAGTIKYSANFPATWKDGKKGVKIPAGYHAWFNGAEGPITVEGFESSPPTTVPAKESDEWHQLAAVFDLTRRFEASNAALNLKDKDHLRVAVAGGYLQAQPPTESLGFEATWKVAWEKGSSTKATTQALTDRTLWATTMPAVTVSFAAHGQTAAEHYLEIMPVGQGVPVLLALAGVSTTDAPAGDELTHFHHLFGLLTYEGELKNPKGSRVLAPDPSSRDKASEIRTPGRFCPGLQITSK